MKYNGNNGTFLRGGSSHNGFAWVSLYQRVCTGVCVKQQICLHMQHRAPEVFHEAVDVVGLGQGDLEAHSSRDVASQAGETLLSRPADADEEGRTPRHLDKAVEP